MKNFILFSIFLFSLACNNANQEMYGDVEAEFEDLLDIPANQQSAPAQKTESEEITKKVVKTGGIEFQSENIEKDYQKILTSLSKHEAYIENENQSKSSQRINYNLTIRVPSNKYDTLYSSLSGLGIHLNNKYSNIEDVTSRYYDLKSRITNKKALEQRYIELLQKASAIKEILEIEKNLNEVRTDIERLQGQFNYLGKQVYLSSIKVSFYEVLPYEYESFQRKGFGARIFNALDNGWQGFLSFLIGFTTLWPFVIVTIGGIYLFRKVKRKWKKKSV